MTSEITYTFLLLRPLALVTRLPIVVVCMRVCLQIGRNVNLDLLCVLRVVLVLTFLFWLVTRYSVSNEQVVCPFVALAVSHAAV